MLSVQLGSALSLPVIDAIGPAGTAWLRLTVGAVVFVAIARPPLRSLHRADIPVVLGLGVTTGLQTITFLAAIERIALGTSVAIEFLGPLAVAAIRSHTRRALAWPTLALGGVVLLTEPWRGDVDFLGVALAALAGIGWAFYILLTQRIGDRFSGLGGLAITVPVAALTAATVGIPQAADHLTPHLLIAAAGLALLLPVLPFSLELLVLRRMTHHAFGTLMALEPAIGVTLGLLVLHQNPAPSQLLGIVLVVLAGAAAQHGGQREPDPDPPQPPAQPQLDLMG